MIVSKLELSQASIKYLFTKGLIWQSCRLMLTIDMLYLGDSKFQKATFTLGTYVNRDSSHCRKKLMQALHNKQKTALTVWLCVEKKFRHILSVITRAVLYCSCTQYKTSLKPQWWNRAALLIQKGLYRVLMISVDDCLPNTQRGTLSVPETINTAAVKLQDWRTPNTTDSLNNYF